MVTFAYADRYLLVANEGEADGDPIVDPEGSVTVIEPARPLSQSKVRTGVLWTVCRASAACAWSARGRPSPRIPSPSTSPRHEPARRHGGLHPPGRALIPDRQRGNARDRDGCEEEERPGDDTLDPAAFPNDEGADAKSLTAALSPLTFNADSTPVAELDNRSGANCREPEGVDTG